MRCQCRALIPALKPYFRLVFADAPFFCQAGPGVIPVYQEMGPFRRWLRWQHVQPEMDNDTMLSEIEYQIESAMIADDKAGGSGPWLGLLGFSQGAKLAASILYDRQLRIQDTEDTNVIGFGGAKWRFAVIMAGRAPLVSLSELSAFDPTLTRPGEVRENVESCLRDTERKITLPTVHVHGMKDTGLWLHQMLYDEYCERKHANLVEWDGHHRIPIKSKEVNRIVDAILEASKVMPLATY